MNTQTPMPMSADITTQLAGLHDIHLPDPVAWWPLAPGWWALTGMVMIAIMGVALIRRHRRRSLKQAALRELSELAKTHSGDSNIQALAIMVGVLIRRVVLSLPGGRQYANVHGQRWSDYLAALPAGMPESVALLLAEAPYAEPDSTLPTDRRGSGTVKRVSNTEIIAEASTWIRRHA